MVVDKKVKLKLVGLNGNAFVLMGAFQAQAKREGWTAKEIAAVLDDAKSGNYAHLVSVLSDHCEGGGAGEDEDWDDEDE